MEVHFVGKLDYSVRWSQTFSPDNCLRKYLNPILQQYYQFQMVLKSSFILLQNTSECEIRTPYNIVSMQFSPLVTFKNC